MKSKDVVIGMRVVPTAKSLGMHSFASVKAKMTARGFKFLYVGRWNKEDKCFWLREPYSQDNSWLFLSKEFEPYVEESNEV